MCKIQPIYCEKSVTDADTPVVSFVFFFTPSPSIYAAFQATPSTDSSHVLWRTLLKYIQEVIEHFLTSQERTEVRITSVQRTVLSVFVYMLYFNISQFSYCLQKYISETLSPL